MNETPKDFLDNFKESVNKDQQTFESILNDLNTNAKYQAFFDKYSNVSVVEFKEKYARYKTDSLAYKEVLQKAELEKAMAFSDIAIDCLWDIQYFKLFQLQCKWRANEIVLPGVRNIYDFFYWQLNMEQCTFIEPISKGEVALYIKYLQQEQGDKVFEFNTRCQMFRYEDYKQNKDNQKELPPYYWFMFNLVGRSMFDLPDIQGDKMKRYYDAVNEYDKQHNPPPPPDPNADNRPYISGYADEEMIPFLKHIGEQKLIEFRAVKKYIDNTFSGWPYFDRAVDLLIEAGDDWPVEYHEDWHIALVDASLQYKKSMVIKILPKVYENYLFLQQNGIGFNPPSINSFFKEHFMDVFYVQEAEKIKKGMKLLGEDGAIDL